MQHVAAQVDAPPITPEQAIALITSPLQADEFRISAMGSDTTSDAFEPAVAYNAAANEYLVVWRGDDNTGGQLDNEYEVYAQCINASTGAEVGPNDFLISDKQENDGIEASPASVAADPTTGAYLVAFINPLQLSGEWETFLRVVSQNGFPVGGRQRITSFGPDGSGLYGPFAPTGVACAGSEALLGRLCLSVMAGFNESPVLSEDESEIFGAFFNTVELWLPFTLR